MYRCLGWSRADCAKFLHVTERCLHNWEAGRHPVPYAAYRLLRIHCGMALPGREWRGWSISRGKLCTPEGHELSPQDANWWSLLVRRAELGSEALRQLHQLKQAGAAADQAERRGRAGLLGHSQAAGRVLVTPVISLTSDTAGTPSFAPKGQLPQWVSLVLGGVRHV